MYEAGIVTSENAWSDNPPQPSTVQPPKVTRVSGAYEMRWWAPNRDDIVADVFVFDQTGQARDFFSARLKRPLSAGWCTNTRAVTTKRS